MNTIENIKNKYQELRNEEEKKYKNEIIQIQNLCGFTGNFVDLKPHYDKDMKYFMKLVRIHHKFIERMKNKYNTTFNNNIPSPHGIDALQISLHYAFQFALLT